MGAFESGQAFLAGVLAKLPTELQTQAKELFAKPEAKDAIVLVGDGALARPEFSKAMDDLAKQKTDLEARAATLEGWYADNKAAIDEYLVIKPEYDTLKGKQPDPPKDPKDPKEPIDPRKIVEDVFAEQGPQYVQVSAWLAAKAVEHLHTFGEPLQAVELVSDPRLGKPIAGQPGRVFSLQDAYTAKYGERVAAKAKEAHDKGIEAEVQKRLAEERAKGMGQPFPLRNQAPSVLDVLTTDKGPAAHTIDTAVAEFDRLQQARG